LKSASAEASENTNTPIEAPAKTTQDPELVKWQKTLLPVMTLFVIALATLFFVFSMNALHQVDDFVQGEHAELRAQIKDVTNQPKPTDTAEDAIRRGLLLLEADALDRRYHQASALLMSRIWAKHLAFMTGMIMAFMGAIFILGKMSESPSEVKGYSSGWNVSITSASPGILLAFFGTVLVALSIAIQGSVDVRDVPVYLRSVTVQVAPKSSAGIDQSNIDAVEKLLDQATPTPTPGKK
jgi:hypothetical protein